MIWIDVNTAITVPVNLVPLVLDTDGKTIDETIAYNESGMDLNWNFVTSAGVVTQTNVVPTTSGVYDWTHIGNGIYKIEIPASGGGSANNDTEGYGWFSGDADNVLPFAGPIIGFRAAADIIAAKAALDACEFAAKLIKNKADQNKVTGEVRYYDDDGETIISTHTPTEDDQIITRNVS